MIHQTARGVSDGAPFEQLKSLKLATMQHQPRLLYPAISGAALLAGAIGAAGQPAAPALARPAKPTWLTVASLGVKEGYDNNVLLVANRSPGLSPQASWITTISPKLGVDFAPLLGRSNLWQTLALTYAPDFAIYHEASSESYNAHRLNQAVKARTGDVSFSLDNAFLFNDGSRQAPTYALDQSGVTANQYDKYRNIYSTAAVRERRKQIQDRATVSFQYDADQYFLRPIATLLDYGLMTDWHNNGSAPYLGYQNYVDRADVNGGLDAGYKLTPKLAATLGYRYGHQYQQSFPNAIDSNVMNGQQEQSSNDYQRILAGLEGHPWSWLNVKLAGGPDFRHYNPAAAVFNHYPVKFYGEAALTATLTANQSLTFSYKQWQWLSSVGKVPYYESTYSLAYHANLTRKLGLDLGGKLANSDYTSGNNVSGNAPSLHNDSMLTVSGGLSYAFTPHFSLSAAYANDFGRNNFDGLPAALHPEYRNFEHQTVFLAAVYQF